MTGDLDDTKWNVNSYDFEIEQKSLLYSSPGLLDLRARNFNTI